MTRFPLGSYIQVDNEIMRIASSSLSGTPTNKITVIRGALATSPTSHDVNSTIRKIKVPSIEFRRPSIIRASGHTFEYLGYGPGNYSTALPQVQDRTLTEREEFLSQAQERSSGLVVYTGMNNKGDFYIGNQKKSSATGEEITFDTPIPTITGQDPSTNSVVFDEVIIKNNLVVEGGASGEVLSQFDGPVTFDGKIKATDQVKISNPINSTGATSGALVVTGGVGIGKSLTVSGSIIGNLIGNVTGQADGADKVKTLSTDTNSSFYLSFVDSNNDPAAANESLFTDSALNYNPSTNILTVPSVLGDLNGNAATATKLATAITIGGVSFDGSASINLAGVNIAGNQNTSGNAATATLATAVTTTGNSTDSLQRIAFHSQTSGSANLRNDVGLRYNPSSNLLSVSGPGSFGGDITAFASDERLKTNISPITDALFKVNSLNGFTYNFNEIAGGLGFDTEIDYAGVSAQEVQKVLPEVVRPAPVDDKYITVQYDKLTALLIEAVKELSDKVEKLEQRLEDK